MKIIETSIPDVKIIEPEVFIDERGFFMETWQQEKFDKLVTGKETKFVQDNHSKSKKGILRGLHFQKKRTQGKLVRVISGKIFDVAVDVRRDSPTFGKSVAVILSEKNMRQLWIPEGFAHGFYVMSQSVDFAYKCTEFYEPNSNVTLDWEDKQLGIDWPISGEVVLSENDKEGKSFNQCLNEDLLL